MKARFMSEQPSVKVIESDNYFYVFICLNGEAKTELIEQDNNTETQSYIEYDYEELVIQKDDPVYDIEDIKAHPELYIGINDNLSVLKSKKIAESKEILEQYLASHPLFSTAKYPKGRYYTVTGKKQRQLTSKMAMYNIYTQQNKQYDLLKWNDTGNICEPWTIEELTQLSMEIDAYITPLVSKQQSYEVAIKEAQTEDELNNIVFSIK